MSLFNSPLLLGFDEFERALERIAKAPGDGYPPYNIERVGGDSLRITLAVAGFGKDDLSVSVEDNQLTIRGRHAEEDGKVYLHRGIAARQFQKSFVLAEGIQVSAATLDNGLLSIELARPERVARPRTIEINTGRRAKGEKTGEESVVSIADPERKAS
jgi:HSP20 family molecular chaperone IbpA